MWTRTLSVIILFTVVGAKRGNSRTGTGTGTHKYPSSNGYSGTSTGGKHTYPQNNGLSGHGNQRNTQRHAYTEVHNHYHYNPPPRINYPGYGSSYHPVYQGSPPTYVYRYRDSGSSLNTLITGLALYNLGRMTTSNYYRDYNSGYRRRSGEECILGIKKENGDYNEFKVDCQIMTTFIYDAVSSESDTTEVHRVVSQTTCTSSNYTEDSNNTICTTKVVDALQVKGPPLKVTPGMECYMIRRSYDSNMRKMVPCGLLEAYSENSMRRSHGDVIRSDFFIVFVAILIGVEYVV